MDYLTTPHLAPGDIILRKSDGSLWTLVESVEYGGNKEAYILKFFSLTDREYLRYTSPWGPSLPASAFKLL